ncbi:MAG TPA: hypothetical protein VN228_05405 [Pyrinomonadaceae bacterium]|nr:hypothetical protein [Pyrinomonadaceae bacterium]
MALVLLFALAPAGRGQSAGGVRGLPRGAFVVETRPLDLGGGRRRALLLWMLGPSRHPFAGGDDESYTCPDQTRGSHYHGPTRVSLLDTAAGRVINTVRVMPDDEGAEDVFDIPYRLRPGNHYHVEGGDERKEGRAVVTRLRDYNGDGESLEFALYDAVACMPLMTALYGYSRRQDRVVQYDFHLEVSDGGKISRQVWRWVDYLFAREPARPGRWNYEIDYRGRGGSLDGFEIRYNPSLERFEGKVARTAGGQ